MHMYLRWHLFYIVAIGFGHFRRLWFVSYLRIVCLATPPRLEDPPSPLYQSGTLFSNLALEPCHKMRALGFAPHEARFKALHYHSMKL